MAYDDLGKWGRTEKDVYSGALCPGTSFPLSFVLQSGRRVCDPHGGSVPGEKALVPWQQTQAPLFERSILLPHVNGREAGCHMVPAGSASLLKAHCIPGATVLTHRN